MGWGITINTSLYFSKVDYRTKEDVRKDIDENNENIAYIKSEIKKYVYTTEPAKVVPKDYQNDPMGYINERVDELLEALDDLITDNTRLYILESDWDKAHHPETGKAIVPYNPNQDQTESARCSRGCPSCGRRCAGAERSAA